MTMLVYIIAYAISSLVVGIAVYRWGLKQGYTGAKADMVSAHLYPNKKKVSCAGKACDKPECNVDTKRVCSNKTRRIVLKG